MTVETWMCAQIFHICYPVEYPDGQQEMFKWSFICPNQTVFDQVNIFNNSFSRMASKPDGLETVLSSTYKSFIELYYREFTKNIKVKIIRLIGANKTGFYLIIFKFNFCKKLSII